MAVKALEYNNLLKLTYKQRDMYSLTKVEYQLKNPSSEPASYSNEQDLDDKENFTKLKEILQNIRWEHNWKCYVDGDVRANLTFNNKEKILYHINFESDGAIIALFENKKKTKFYKMDEKSSEQLKIIFQIN
jgi:hypothetical protein